MIKKKTGTGNGEFNLEQPLAHIMNNIYQSKRVFDQRLCKGSSDSSANVDVKPESIPGNPTLMNHWI